MSIPSGAKELNGSIGPTNVYYLTDVNTVTSSFSVTDFTSKTAKPTKNCNKNIVSPATTKTIEDVLPDTFSTGLPTLFTKFPNFVDNTLDITIESTETDLDLTFINEGAEYSNACGYYFYYIDSNGDPKVLTNADSNTNSNPTDPYFRPTIVFPNASLNRSGGNLQPGLTRILKGNLPNGKFQNVNVGFFIISNGWNSSPSHGHLSTGTGYVMHTTNQLNANYDSSYLSEEDVPLTDPRRGIQSTLLFYYDKSSWILSFEDILRPEGDSDFNDLILFVKSTPGPDEVVVERYTSVVPQIDDNVKGQSDSEGIYIWVDVADVCNDGSDLLFDRKTYFRSNNITFMRYDEEITISPKEYVKGIMQNLNWNYTDVGTGIIDETTTSITQRFRFRPIDISSNTSDGKAKLYILSRGFNVDTVLPVNEVSATNYDMLLDYQSVYVDLWHENPGNSTYIINEDFTFWCGTNGDVPNNALETLGTNFTKTTVVLLAWGDPYVQKIDGVAYKVPDIEGTLTLLKNPRILIEAEISKSPHTEQLPDLKGTTFFKKFIIDITGKSHFEIDLNTLTFSSHGKPIRYTLGYDKDAIQGVKDPYLKHAIESETKFVCLSVYIEGVKVTFVKLPSFIDIQNVVLFDMGSIKYYATTDSCGAMIHENQVSIRTAPQLNKY